MRSFMFLTFQLQAPSPLNKKSLLNSEESVAAKSRALQRLMKNVRNVEVSRLEVRG